MPDCHALCSKAEICRPRPSLERRILRFLKPCLSESRERLALVLVFTSYSSLSYILRLIVWQYRMPRSQGFPVILI
jgi:hypothetical protein